MLIEQVFVVKGDERGFSKRSFALLVVMFATKV